LDEATSALDNLTEAEVIRTIKSLNGNCTILMIAHRLSTIENCDKIVLLEHGKIVAEGTYTELLQDVKSFRNLAGVQQ
jgi:ABC-type multidrug transport system fused ATPase/permease subunit